MKIDVYSNPINLISPVHIYYAPTKFDSRCIKEFQAFVSTLDVQNQIPIRVEGVRHRRY